MSTFAQNPKVTQQTMSVKSTIPGRAHLRQSRGVNSNLHLQRTMGNQAVQRLLQENTGVVKGGSTTTEIARVGHDFRRIPLHTPGVGAIQTKLAISKPGDKYEQEADHVADQVMRMVEPSPIGSAAGVIQRMCTGCEDEKEEAAPTERVSSVVEQGLSKGATTAAVALQSVEGQVEEYPPVTQATIFRKAEIAMPSATTESALPITDRLIGGQSGGEPLPRATRQKMENAFGYDFSRVRIHQDAEAGKMSRQFSALAFTHGSHIYFGNGKYDPHGSSGSRLLAHELTHVVQQGQADRQSRNGAAGQVPVGHAMSGSATQASPPMIQRTATWAAGPVHEVNNLATAILNGTVVGVTWPKLNGSTFWSTAAARAAMRSPTVVFSSAASGGVDAQVATVPTNTGSFDETVLAAGPWTTVVPKATVGAKFASLASCTGAGNSTFRAIGKPTDADMFAANRRHEDRHATDHQAAFNGSIVPWDTNLAAAHTAGTTYNGPTEADAEAALYAAMGGTPNQVADAFMNACQAAVIAYHGTAAGGAVSQSNPSANATCSTSSVEATNPS